MIALHGRSTPCARWQVISGLPRRLSDLHAITAASVADIWAIGDKGKGDTNGQPTFIHWNGRHWYVVPSAPTGDDSDSLSGIASAASHDVWAVGRRAIATNAGWVLPALIEHWDGSRWHVLPGLPSPGVADTYSLNSIAAISAHDVWAVGASFIDGRSDSLSAHWNGQRWQIVPGVSVAGTTSRLVAVAGKASNDVWAVGHTFGPDAQRTLVEHWDGRRWRIVPSPNASARNNDLTGLTVVSTRDVWAVGASQRATATMQPLIEHWDGQRWKMAPTSLAGSLGGIVALGPHDLWAVGTGDGGEYAGPTPRPALILHGDGQRWQSVPAPPIGPPDHVASLVAVTAVGPHTLWAVGRVETPSAATSTALIERYEETSCATTQR